MTTYWIKKENEVGLVVANSLHDLFWIVDRYGTPYDYLYCEVEECVSIVVGYEMIPNMDDEGDIAVFKLDDDVGDLHTVVDNPWDKVWTSFCRDDSLPYKE